MPQMKKKKNFTVQFNNLRSSSEMKIYELLKMHAVKPELAQKFARFISSNEKILNFATNGFQFPVSHHFLFRCTRQKKIN